MREIDELRLCVFFAKFRKKANNSGIGTWDRELGTGTGRRPTAGV